MKRVLVLGCPGSGKSYFSKKLAEKLLLPVIHMDNLYWSKDKVACSREELLEKIEPILDRDEWIIDGNYHHTLEERLQKCTDVFFLDLPRETCVEGMKNRIGVERDDIPWIESEEDAEELIKWTEDYQEKNRPLELQLLAEHPEVNVTIFYSRQEMNEYLKDIDKRVFSLYLFDFDGTVVNSEDALYYIFDKAFSAVGLKIEKKDTMEISRKPLVDTYKPMGMDMSKEELFWKVIKEELNSETSNSLTKAYPEMVSTMLELKKRGAMVGIVTSNHIDHVSDVFRLNDISLDLFDVYVGNDETEKHKPNPEPILKGIEMAGYEGSYDNVTYVGDGINDTIAANRAGVKAILIDRINEHPEGNYTKIKTLEDLI